MGQRIVSRRLGDASRGLAARGARRARGVPGPHVTRRGLRSDESSDRWSYRGGQGEGLCHGGPNVAAGGRSARGPDDAQRGLRACAHSVGSSTRQAELDRAIERYYLSLTAAERRENDEWASLGDEAARRAWDE